MRFVCLRCCVPPDFGFHVNNLFSWVLFSPAIYEKRGRKLISKTIKHKLENSSKIQFAFIYPKDINFLLEENDQLCWKSGNDAYSRGQVGHTFCVIMTQCIRKAICCSPLRDKIIILLLNRQSLPPHIEVLFFELNLRNLKRLVCFSYKLHNNLIKENLQILREGIQFYSKDYEKITLMVDYNAEITETNM